jgi:hypothetical protein
MKGGYGISKTLGLPTLDEILKEKESEKEIDLTTEEEEQIAKSSALIHDLSNKMSLLEGADHAEAMDEMHNEIAQHARDLMAFGYNTDMRSARGIFEVAATMYSHAISAKNSKRDAQIKALRLALDKKKVDLEEKRTNHSIGAGNADNVASTTSNGNIVVEDRNELIKRLREESFNEK